jgi:hypothetical protein
VADARQRPTRTSLLSIIALVGAGASGATAVVSIPAFSWQIVVAGTPRAAEATGRTDEEQIVDVLRAISDAYNRKDIQSAEGNLCARARTQWNPQLEGVWMAYRHRHGTLEFTIDFIDVAGTAAHVAGTQVYANDRKPQVFTAEMGRGPHGWKLCSST